jgi:hypothetical protein
MKRSLSVVVAALVALATPAAVRADFLNWSASWGLGQGQGPSFVSGLSNVAVALSQPGPGGATLSVGNFTTNSVTTEADAFHAPYDLSLKVTDNTTHHSGTLTFNGLISGGTGPTSNGLVNTFSNPRQALRLDGHVYSVKIDPSTLLPDTDHGAVPLHASVSVTGCPSHRPPGPPEKLAPEPSGLLLAGVGLSACVGALTRRRKGNAEADTSSPPAAVE